MATNPPYPHSANWTEDMRTILRQLQSETITLVLVGLVLSSVATLLLVIWSANTFWGMALAFGWVALAYLIQRVLPVSFRWASILLIAGTWGGVLGLFAWERREVLVIFWFIPAGLATLLLGLRWGAALTLVNTVCLLAPLPMLAFLSPLTKGVAIFAMLASTGMIWVTLRPLLTAVQWSWSSYRSSMESLNQARDSQVKLYQSLQDLTAVNLQLKRMNQIAQNLRLEAEAERRTKQEFVANVSHELRTPLNMIIGFSRTMLDHPDAYEENIPPKLLADLQVILRNSQHLSSLIDDVLDLSQIDANRMALSKERSRMDEIVEQAVFAVRPLYQSKNLALNVAIPPDLPDLWCDPVRIREVLLNLLSNAGRFSERGEVRVSAYQEGAAVVVSVADTGLGITEEDRQKLFKPFQQVDSSIRRKYGGTGLGLSISKAFVELHDGSMWVDSTVGQGTTFYFKLPVDPVEPVTAGASRWFNPHQSYDETHHVSKISTPEARPRLVIVETGSAMQKLLSRHFSKFEIVAEPTIPDAIQDIAGSGARALLVNALDVAGAMDRLKDIQTLPYSVPAIVCSLPGIEQASNDMGVTNYLVKPISREMLFRAIDELGREVSTILIVDDEPDARQLFRRMLTTGGREYRVLRAANGVQAMETLQTELVDLILLDLAMPQMDGFRFLEERSKIPAIEGIPIILISARDPQGQPIASNALGVTRGGGLSARQVLNCVEALSEILAPADSSRQYARQDGQ